MCLHHAVQAFAMAEVLISFKEFSFTYKAQSEPTLKHINLSIHRGEKILIAGPSGSGKSTLGYCINALIPHAFKGKIEGNATICGLNLADGDMYAVNKRVGTVMQDTDAQFVGITVAEDIAFSLENQCVEQREMHSTVAEIAHVVKMGSFLSHSPQELSGGQKQRVSLAGVLVDDVDILLFDEPLANLDPATGALAIEMIDELATLHNKTVIIIEHRLEEVLHRKVDRILVMQEGKLVSDTRPKELLASQTLRALGLREPLYITALRMAGCDLKRAGDLSSYEGVKLDSVKEAIHDWYAVSQKDSAARERDVLLRLENLSYSYDGLVMAVEGISASIHSGEMISVLGNNGAGKSTLAQLIMGVLRQDSGSISFEGIDLAGYSAGARSDLVGFVMQNPNHMISNDLVFDEVAFALRQRGYEEALIRERVLDVLGLCGLREYHHWPISALSYGQKKRVTIASILVTDPKILLLDEPTSAQDYLHYTALMQFLAELNEKTGLTILFITHDMHLALEYTTRSLVLSGGKLLADLPTSEVFSNPDLLSRANLKETSLYYLAKDLGIADIPLFIEHFVQEERKERPPSVEVIRLPKRKLALTERKKEIKVGKKVVKEGRKFGFALSWEDTDSYLHSFNGVTKIAFFGLWIGFCLLTFDLRFLLPALGFSFYLLWATKVPLRKFLPYIIGILGVIVLNAIFIFLFSPKQGVVYLGSETLLLGNEMMRYALSRETLFYLFVVCVKYLTLFPVALVFVSITHPSEFASSLNRLGIGYTVSYAVSLALRYLPEVTKTYVNILRSQMARGVDISKNAPLRKRLSSMARIIAPLVLFSLDRIEVITNAMVLRGFARLKKRTWYMQSSLRPRDWVALGLTLLFVAASLYIRFARNVMFWYPF